MPFKKPMCFSGKVFVKLGNRLHRNDFFIFLRAVDVKMYK